MLVLTRKPGEAIRIGEDIVVRVVEAGPGKVRLGIEAPRGVRILRTELEKEPDGSSFEQPTLAEV
jgi:carbon storage regulator